MRIKGEAIMNDSISVITFFEGEERVIASEVGNIGPNEVVVISNATWTLTNRQTGEVEKSGSCEVDGVGMKCFFGMDFTGRFDLEITAQVGRETIKQRALVKFV